MDAWEKLGWNEFFKQQLGDVEPGQMPARVVQEERGHFRLRTPQTEVWAQISGKLRNAAEGRLGFPAVGDWVLAEFHGDRATVHAIFQRQSLLVRKMAGEEQDAQPMAANVDIVFIVTSLNLDLNLRRLERTLTAVWNSGASPVILLTKLDLVEDPAAAIAEVEAIAPDVPVHAISARDGSGLDILNSYCQPGTTSVLLGSSGVGKSTLINALIGKERQRTAEIREADGRGRHTTTSRQLIDLESGGMIIDTPGIRELQLWEAEEGLDATFSDIEEIAANCRFSDCAHANEPHCAVKKALADGSLDAARYASYQKLAREAAFQDRKHDKAAMAETRKDWKKLNVEMYRHIKKKKE